jgi:O-antigen biosynthesis protein
MKPAQKKDSLVVITGMHRSGTSALAKVFVDFGYDPGRTLIPAGPDNPEGFWEDANIVNLNDRLLDLLFLNWSTVENFESRRINLFINDLVSEFSPFARKLIAEKLERSPAILIKDPRITILLPFWSRIFNELDAELFLFHIFRNPLSVAKSLEHRNGTPLQNGILLWYYYNLTFLSEVKHRCNFISYQEMLEKPDETIRKIKNIIRLNDSDIISSAAIKPELNHYKIPPDSIQSKSIQTSNELTLWELLKRLEKNPDYSHKEVEAMKVQQLTSQLVTDQNEKLIATLIIHNDHDQQTGPTIISVNTTRQASVQFNIEDEIPPACKFSIYLHDKSCKICVDCLEISTSNETLLIENLKGNYIFSQGGEYIFDSNAPCFDFESTDKITVQQINLLVRISDLEKDDLTLLLAEYKKNNLLLHNKSIGQHHQLLQTLAKEAEIKTFFDKFRDASDLEIAKLRVKQKVLVAQVEEARKKELALVHELAMVEKNHQSQIEQFQQQVSHQENGMSALEICNRKLQSKIDSQAIEIESLEKKSLWLFTELNKAKNSISWKVTTPLRTTQCWLNRLNNKLFILVNDVGASIRLLKREGFLCFFNRLVWYFKGKRLKEEIEFARIYTNKSPQAYHIDNNQLESLVFEQSSQPTVSIVIPIFNNYKITYSCLNSILKNTHGIEYEVIIIDDNSTLPEFDLAEKFVGVNLIKNDENIGFLRSCNKAAAMAQGEYVCILNNDTEVHEGWIKHLVELMDGDNNIAVAGPKLIYPNGRLQEAGGIIWNDASAWNFGKFDNPEKPDFNYLKEVDYISGACLLVRKAVWEQLGGFDQQFAPAYYEDTDLAMQVRKAGYKVVYQPLSVVTHHEGLSNGTDETAGLKKFQVVNHEKFLNKWKHTLSMESSPNGMNVLFHRDRSLNSKHLLVIDHYVPMFDQDAGSRSTFSYLKLFVKMGFKIHFIGDNYFRHEPYTTVLQQMGIEVLYGNYYQKNIRDWFRENGRYIDFVIAHRVHIAPKYFGMIRKFTTAKIAYVGHDLQYLGSQRKFEITGDKKFKKESAKFLKAETRIFSTVDIILPFSTYEEPYIRKMAPDKNVQVIPVCFFDSTPEKVPGFDERRDILFVGYFGHPPNPDAILWFAKEIFPLVHQKVPDARLHVVGSQPTDEVLGLQNDFINVTGYVSDEELINYYRTCKVAILPLRFGAGVKGKLLESLNHQIPTVITPVAAEGVPEIENHSLIAENPKAFAQNISLLYQDKNVWQKYSAGGRVLIEKHYTEEAARKLLEEILPVKT